jgi:hypothetical protein
MKAGRVLLMFVTVVLAACVGCIPYYGLANKRVPKDPRAFTNAKTGAAIGTILVIPRYTSRSGHSPGSIRDKVFIAHPFLYRQGTPFALQQPQSAAVIYVWHNEFAFAGAGTTIDGAIVVAPGYKSRWDWDLWTRDEDLWSHDGKTRTLTPLAASDASKELQTISVLIDQEVLSGPSRDIFSYAGEGPVYVRLTDEEKRMVREFVAEGFAKLLSQP